MRPAACWQRSSRRASAPRMSRCTAWMAGWATPPVRTSKPASNRSSSADEAPPTGGASSRLGQCPQVQLDDLGILEQFVAGAGVRVGALVEDVAAMADLQAPAGVLLDHDDRHPGLVDLTAADEHLVL